MPSFSLKSRPKEPKPALLLRLLGNIISSGQVNVNFKSQRVHLQKRENLPLNSESAAETVLTSEQAIDTYPLEVLRNHVYAMLVQGCLHLSSDMSRKYFKAHVARNIPRQTCESITHEARFGEWLNRKIWSIITLTDKCVNTHTRIWDSYWVH